MTVEVARELAVLRAELAPLGDEVPAVAAVARLAAIAGELAPGPAGAATLPARDDRLLLEGLRAFTAPADPDARHCWFGISAEDGLPWMYCASAAVARAALAVVERLLAGAAQRV